MKYLEVIRDLFSVPADYHLAHCIAADAAMGKGIAVEFRRRFGQQAKLQAMNLRHPDCVLIGRVFNLITKEKSRGKPTPENFAAAVAKMKNLAAANGIKKIAMPLIGAGLDQLSWEDNREIIQRTFASTDIEILICRL